MNNDLEAEFVFNYPEGAAIEGSVRLPADRFSVSVLFGPSGCGKTTVLRCLAGLSTPQSGQICYQDEVWFKADQRISFSPQQRQIGFLFQDYALFPHLTVEQNIGYGLRQSSKQDRVQTAVHLLQRFELNGLEKRYPHQLSGGQQQRVALARALANRPRLLLLDEPLSALDDNLRRELRSTLRKMLAEFNIPVVIVTHDRFEAMAFAENLIVMDQGKVLQQGPVEEVFSRPNSPAVARIVGTETVLVGHVNTYIDGLARVQIGDAELLVVTPEDPGKKACLCIQAEHVMLQRGVRDEQSVRNQFAGTIQSIVPEGPLVRVRLDCGFEITALISRDACRDLDLHEAGQVTVAVKAAAIHLIPQ